MKEAVISTPRLNSYGARVLTEGIDLTQYLKNPILLYMHRRGGKEDMPIGIMENLRVENGILYGTPKFDDDTEDERNISKKWDRGTLRMLSAGLDIIEWSEDPALLVSGQTRPTVTKSKLREVSVVDIGANDDALQVGLYHEGQLLNLAAGEESEHLPLLACSRATAMKESEQIQNNNSCCASGKPITKNMEKILLKLGLAPGATEDDAVAAISKLQEEKATMTLARITDAVDTAIKERRITADKKDKYLTLGKQVGIDSLNALFADMSPIQKPLDLVKPTGGASGAADVKLTWATASADQLAELREGNREEYMRLYREHFGFDPAF